MSAEKLHSTRKEGFTQAQAWEMVQGVKPLIWSKVKGAKILHRGRVEIIEEEVTNVMLGLVQDICDGTYDPSRAASLTTYVNIFMLKYTTEKKRTGNLPTTPLSNARVPGKRIEIGGKARRLIVTGYADQMREQLKATKEAHITVTLRRRKDGNEGSKVEITREAAIRELALHERRVVHLDAPAEGGKSFEIRAQSNAALHTCRMRVLEEVRRTVMGMFEGKERETVIIEKRLLAEDDEKITLEGLSNRFGVTKERVRQIEAKILKQIRQRLLACLPPETAAWAELLTNGSGDEPFTDFVV